MTQASEYTTLGEERVVPGLGRVRRVVGKYDYVKDGSRCGVEGCGGLGFPWGGWFTCEDRAHAAILETGECFEIIGGPFV